MIRHHPDSAWLADYAAGSLSTPQALAVHTHLHYCSSCRQQVRRLEALGSLLVEQTGHDGDSEALLAATLARLETPRTDAGREPPPSADLGDWPFPAPVALLRLLPVSPVQAPWQRLGRALRACRLRTGSARHEVALHHIRAGGRVARHSHRGEEITVVLQGSFSDALGQYAAGDFIRRDGHDRHAPQAAAHEDCICLTVVDAPVRFLHPLLRPLNPLLRIHPA